MKAGFETVQDINNVDDRYLMKVRNMGEKSVRIVRQEIRELMTP
jgi:DNA-directed RNA polymerase alpha subunit